MRESGDKQLIQQLSRSSLYRDYERAFNAATGMPLALRAFEHWQMALHGNTTCLTFTDYLSRVRIEKAKSLTHFNRMFRKLGANLLPPGGRDWPLLVRRCA